MHKATFKWHWNGNFPLLKKHKNCTDSHGLHPPAAWGFISRPPLTIYQTCLCLLNLLLIKAFFEYCKCQRWSRGHKARGQGQGHKKNPRPRPRTAFPRTDTLEAKDRNARGQGPRTQAQVLSKKERSSQKFFKRSPQKNVFQKIFQALHKILTIQKIVLSSSRGQANFRGLEASRPRPRTSKSVLEDSTSGKCNKKC